MLTPSTIWAVLRSPVARYVLSGVVVAGLCWRGYVVVYDRGVAACEGRHAVARAAAIEHAQVQAREIVVQDAKVTKQGAATRERIRVVYRARESALAGSASIDCGACRLADDSVRLLNDALANTATTPTTYPGEQHDPVPRPSLPGG